MACKQDSFAAMTGFLLPLSGYNVIDTSNAAYYLSLIQSGPTHHQQKNVDAALFQSEW